MATASFTLLFGQNSGIANLPYRLEPFALYIDHLCRLRVHDAGCPFSTDTLSIDPNRNRRWIDDGRIFRGF